MKNSVHIYLFLLLSMPCFLPNLPAQDLFPGRGTAFQDDEVPRVDIIIPESSINTILAPGNEFSDQEFAANFIFTDSEEADTMLNVGFRLRGNTARLAGKKSFKVSFNTFIPGRDWKGLEKINLNGEHNDPSISRSKTAWALLKDLRVPGARANHVELYINGEYRGLYANIEQIDEEFVERRFGNKDGNLYKCLYPADLAYLGNDPDAYKLMADGRRVYDLRTNEEEDDYSDLANFISVINQASLTDLPCELEAIFNVDAYLRTMAFDVLSGNWDGYWNKNNFYLYNNTATGKFEYIPFDVDNTFGIDWFNIDWAERNMYDWVSSDEDRPLIERLLEVPDYRARFTYYIQKVMEEDFNSEVLFAQLDELQVMLAPFVAADDFYPLDYGFSTQDFQDAFDGETSYDHTPYGVKSFVITRREAIMSQMEDLNPAPILSGIRSGFPSVGEQIAYQVMVEEDNAVAEVLLCYQLAGEAEVCTEMSDSGNVGDGEANDGEYGVFLPAVDEAMDISWHIEATDNEGASSRLPLCGEFTTTVTVGGLSLAINEFMASNDMTILDEEGESDDWVEIHNYGTSSISLNGLYLSDNPDLPTKWAFPDISIAAGEFLLVWTDDDEEQGPLHTNFKLDADGEFIGIFDTDENDNALIDGTEFGEQETDTALGRLPNGTGAIQAVGPTPGASNEPVSVTGVGFEEVAFEVYPNPTAGMLRIQAPRDGNFRAWLTDALGNRVAAYEWRSPRQIWEMDLPAGIYFLLIEEDGQAVYSTKVIKQ